MSCAPIPRLAAALAAAQAKFKPLAKNREVTIRPKERAAYTFRYADLQACIEATRPALAEQELAVIQTITGGELITTLVHSSGEAVSSSIPLGTPRDLAEPKAYGAAVTYLRRYAYTAILCLAADDDLDEDGKDPGEEQAEGRRGGRAADGRQARGDQASKAESAPQLITEGQAKWLERKILAGGQTVEAVLKRFNLGTLAAISVGDFETLRGELS